MDAYFITFENGLRAIFKTEEKPWGIYGEVAAYRVSEALGFYRVPPTVLRTIDGKIGSLQLFVETDIDLVASKTKRQEAYKKVPKEDWNLANLLHFIIGQWDRHAGNFLIDREGHLVVIDNGDMMSEVHWRLGEYPWTLRGSTKKTDSPIGPFPFDQVQVLNNPSLKEMEDTFSAYIKNEKILRIYEKELVKDPNRQLSYIIWGNQLWIPRRAGMDPITIDHVSSATRDRLVALQDNGLKNLISDLVSKEKIAEIQLRIALILKTFGSHP
jgi:hypothetical protein